MDIIPQHDWHPVLRDPSGCREEKPRQGGKTMVIDKGLGLHAMEDLLQTAAAHIDMIKIGFGTSPLYPINLLQQKIKLVKAYGICIYPGGTFLEAAINAGKTNEFFQLVQYLGYTGVEISDGTIEIDRSLRSELIVRAVDKGYTVITEYGKKCWGSVIEIEELIQTVHTDTELGAALVTIEGRESGAGVGIFDADGKCKDAEIEAVLARLASPRLVLWEAPQKAQQVHLLKMLGPDIHIGNVASQDVLSLEALRRGLRSDTFEFGQKALQAAKG